jgi:hypothetical protein
LGDVVYDKITKVLSIDRTKGIYANLENFSILAWDSLLSTLIKATGVGIFFLYLIRQILDLRKNSSQRLLESKYKKI